MKSFHTPQGGTFLFPLKTTTIALVSPPNPAHPTWGGVGPPNKGGGGDVKKFLIKYLEKRV